MARAEPKNAGRPYNDALLRPSSVDTARAQGVGPRAGVRRSRARAAGWGDGRHTTLCAQDLVVDLDARLVAVGDRVITMPRKELDILAVLVGAAGRVVDRSELIDQVWGPRGAPVKSLDVHIRRIRHRIEPDAHRPRYIRTVRGSGYIFDTVVPSPTPITSHARRGPRSMGAVRPAG